MKKPTNKELNSWGYIKTEALLKVQRKTFDQVLKYVIRILNEDRKEMKKSMMSIEKFVKRERKSLFKKELEKSENKK